MNKITIGTITITVLLTVSGILYMVNKNETQDGVSKTDTLYVCSFNIQFLGHYKKKDNEALADILEYYDLIAI